MIEKQRVLLIGEVNNKLNPYLTRLQDRVNSTPRSGLTINRLNFARTAPEEIFGTIRQHLSSRDYDIVLAPMDLDVCTVVRRYHREKVVGYTWSFNPVDKGQFDGVINFLYLRDFYEGAISRIRQHLRA